MLALRETGIHVRGQEHLELAGGERRGLATKNGLRTQPQGAASPVRGREGGGEGRQGVQGLLALGQQPGRVQAIEGQPQALALAPALLLEAEVLSPVVRQALELQHLEVEIQQPRMAVQQRRLLCQQVARPGDEIRQRLLQLRRQLGTAVVVRLPPLLALQRQHGAVDPLQGGAQPAGRIPFDRHQVGLAQAGAIHAPGSLRQVVGLVQQHAPAPPVLPDQSAQGGGKTVDVMQIGNHHIHPGQQVQGQLVGADAELARQLLDVPLAQGGALQGRRQRGRQAIVVAPGKAAVIAVAGLAG